MRTDSQRLKIFMVQERDVLDLVWCNELPGHFMVHRLPGLPEGARVVAVHHRYERRAFAFIVEHESFPEAAPCAELEIVPEPLEFSRDVLVRQGDGSYRLQSG